MVYNTKCNPNPWRLSDGYNLPLARWFYIIHANVKWNHPEFVRNKLWSSTRSVKKTSTLGWDCWLSSLFDHLVTDDRVRYSHWNGKQVDRRTSLDRVLACNHIRMFSSLSVSLLTELYYIASSRIWGFQGGEYEDSCILGCCAV